MENHEFDDWEFEANGHIHAYDKRKAVEKATDKLLKVEEKEPLCDRIANELRDAEFWHNYWIYNFLR